MQFGRLVAHLVDDKLTVKGGKTFWSCQCVCGTWKSVAIGNLSSGSTVSCGCRKIEVLDKTTHGVSHMVEYGIWSKMLGRCQNKHLENYKHYGGRGISVCERWLLFSNFMADMGSRPTGTTLGRKDNDGDYEPTNCAWETSEEQSNNKRTTRRLTFRGRTQSLAQWSRELGIPIETLFSRLKNMTTDKAFTVPRG